MTTTTTTTTRKLTPLFLSHREEEIQKEQQVINQQFHGKYESLQADLVQSGLSISGYLLLSWTPVSLISVFDVLSLFFFFIG